mmetsp:Transcript_56619/g.132867  ORF Transcript_56619/g.132867 Transcript_56619/m.132867 type:complete len:376 (+) Transcript_56619:59-1186(+)
MEALKAAGLAGHEEDSRVKKLQELAWSLQSLTSKPGGKLPEVFKKECGRLASDAVQLCTDAGYMDEADFFERAAVYTKKIEAKKVEAATVEEREKDKLADRCFRRGQDGMYLVGNREQLSVSTPSGPLTMTSSSTGGASKLSASTIAAECLDDPEALWLSDRDIRDSDVDALCQGLRQAGSGLTSLDLSHNQLADAGVQKLVGALAAGTCPKLKELWIGANQFGDLGFEMLTNGLVKLRKDLKVHAEVELKPATDAAAAPPDEKVPDTEGADIHGLTQAVTDNAASADAGGVAAGGHKVEETSEGGLRITLHLPDDIQTAKDLVLDVSESRLLARTLSGAEVADIALPPGLDASSCEAKFSKKLHTMTVAFQSIK